VYIKEVECSNYLSYGANAVLPFKQGLNIIIGENNSGKTNVVRAMDVIFDKLHNHTRITTRQLQPAQDGNINLEIPSQSADILIDEYHNKNSKLNIKLHINLGLENIDSVYLSQLKRVLKDTPEEG
jgi:AAA15 family ATPase/GTPase